MNFGNNLKVFRKNSKMSQESLADKIGVTRQSVSKWEVGEAYPEMSNIVALCKIFHCEITDLINDNIVDYEKFDSNTQREVTMFKKSQQKMMKRISKSISIIANISRFIIIVPLILLIIITIVFPFTASTFEINENNIKYLNKEIDFEVEDNFITLGDNKTYVNTSSDIKKFFSSHDSRYYIICIEYILVCITILVLVLFLLLHNLYILYKNISKDSTPFSLTNELIAKRIVCFYAFNFIFSKITALLFSLITGLDLEIEFNLTDVITILAFISFLYLFKYGRMIQVDSNSKIYD